MSWPSVGALLLGLVPVGLLGGHVRLGGGLELCLGLLGGGLDLCLGLLGGLRLGCLGGFGGLPFSGRLGGCRFHFVGFGSIDRQRFGGLGGGACGGLLLGLDVRLLGGGIGLGVITLGSALR